MSKFNVLERIRSMSAKQLVVGGVFALALAGAVGLGLHTKQNASAASSRDCSANSVNLRNMNGGCGALTPRELVADMRQNNPSDLQAAYSKFGLTPAKYDRFANTAIDGMADTNGDVWVDGQKVMEKAWSIGRTKFSYSKNYQIGNTTFYSSWHTDVLKQNLPVMVMFNADGVAEAVVIKACGNPLGGTAKPSAYRCDGLNKTAVAGKQNTYRFTTNAYVGGLAKIKEVRYTFTDGGKTTTVVKTNPSEPVEKTFAASGTAKVEVIVQIPGRQTKIVSGANCVKEIKVVTPFYACVQLSRTTLNSDKREYRFTVTTRQGNGATLKDVDFTLDGKSTITGVTQKDAQGNIYQDYTFDKEAHTVVAKVNFNVAGGVQSKTCEGKVLGEKTPECKPGIPVGHPDCEPKKEECKPGVPVGDKQCEEQPPVLPETGMGSVLGIFAGTSALGAIAHRVVTSRRQRF